MSLFLGWSRDRSFGRGRSQLKLRRFTCSNLLLHAYQAALRYKCVIISYLSVRPANLSSHIMRFSVNHLVRSLHLTILCPCSCCFCQRDKRAKSGCVLTKRHSPSAIKCISVLPHGFALHIFLSCCLLRFCLSVAKRLWD